tara:strand:- start:119 stop:262 length:144 start_codon:yes stop_codon:yes gene_type:complete
LRTEELKQEWRRQGLTLEVQLRVRHVALGHHPKGRQAHGPLEMNLVH